MWYRLILSAVREVGRGGEYTIHKTMGEFKSPLWSMSYDRDPSSSIGLGSKFFGPGHYTSQNPAVSYGYSNLPNVRREKLPYGAKIFDTLDIDAETYNKILDFKGIEDPSKRATSNKTIKDLSFLNINVSNIELLKMGFDAIEYPAFTIQAEAIQDISLLVRNLLLDYFLKDKKINFKNSLQYLSMNEDKIEDIEEKNVLEEIDGEWNSIDDDEAVWYSDFSDETLNFLEAVRSFNKFILSQWENLSKGAKAYTKRNLSDRRINSLLRQSVNKNNLLILNSLALTNPRLFQKEKFRPELLTDEEKEYIEKKKYSSAYDVTKELVLNAIKKYGNKWKNESGLNLPFVYLFRMFNDNLLSREDLNEYIDQNFNKLQTDDIISIINSGFLVKDIDAFLDKIKISNNIRDSDLLKYVDIEDKDIAKKLISKMIPNVEAFNTDSAKILIENDLVNPVDILNKVRISTNIDIVTLLDIGKIDENILSSLFDRVNLSNIYSQTKNKIGAKKYIDNIINENGINFSNLIELLDSGFQPEDSIIDKTKNHFLNDNIALKLIRLPDRELAKKLFDKIFEIKGKNDSLSIDIGILLLENSLVSDSKKVFDIIYRHDNRIEVLEKLLNISDKNISKELTNEYLNNNRMLLPKEIAYNLYKNGYINKDKAFSLIYKNLGNIDDLKELSKFGVSYSELLEIFKFVKLIPADDFKQLEIPESVILSKIPRSNVQYLLDLGYEANNILEYSNSILIDEPFELVKNIKNLLSAGVDESCVMSRLAQNPNLRNFQELNKAFIIREISPLLANPSVLKDIFYGGLESNLNNNLSEDKNNVV